jgi:hypothetical protein
MKITLPEGLPLGDVTAAVSIKPGAPATVTLTVKPVLVELAAAVSFTVNAIGAEVLAA